MSYDEAKEEGQTESAREQAIKSLIRAYKPTRSSTTVRNADTGKTSSDNSATTNQKEDICDQLGGSWDSEKGRCTMEIEVSIGD